MELTKSIICKVDKRGGISLPLSIRKALDLSQNSRLEFQKQEDGSVILKKVASACFFCGAPGPLMEMRGISICQDCCGGVAALDDTETE